MKKVIYVLILSSMVLSGLVFASRKSNNQTPEQPISRPPSAAEMNAGLKAWEATSEGKKFKKWKESAAGKKVLASTAKIRHAINAFADMEAVVISLSLPPGSRLGFGVMVRINGEDYILNFAPEIAYEFKQLQSLKVNDRLIIRSRGVSYAPKYAYPIVSGDYVERNGEIIYKRKPKTDGC